MIEAIIVAGGRGERMGGVYKQFSLLGNKPVFLYSLERFIEYGVNSVILVVPKEKVSFVKELVEEFREKVKVVVGGERRQDSVYSGFKESSGELILIHDAVRPFVSVDIIREVVEGVKKVGICAPGIPVKDTLKLYKKDEILWTLERRNLLQVQTPQGFRREILKEIVDLYSKYSFTDELAFAERLNYKICWVKGDPMNIKITYQDDMELAKAILEYRKNYGNKF
ncbi:MAG: 2-C-methyl-D-erythritol 4-phosphate cytidylyltransferase [candidate division WOR-3 bacterium]